MFCAEEVDDRLKDLKTSEASLLDSKTLPPDMIKDIPKLQSPEEKKHEENEPAYSEDDSSSSEAPPKMNLRNRGRQSTKPNKSKVAASGKKADRKRQVKEN